MKMDQTFYVVKDTVTGEILEETKASGFARPALYGSETSALRAKGQRCKEVRIPNPNCDRKRLEALRDNFANLSMSERQEYYNVGRQYIWVPAPEGRFVVVPVTISEVINGKQ